MFIRNCPKCESELSYKTKLTLYSANKKGSLCRRCANIGENNPMYNKNMYDIWLSKYGEKIATEKWENHNKNRKEWSNTDEFRKKISSKTKGENNAMYGKSFYDIWKLKYGKEIADDKLNKFKKKQSKLNKGRNNSMYGKPSPKKGGKGWKGWYKSHFFKSLKELYCILEFEKQEIEWIPADNNKFVVPYINWKGIQRNYFPDFFLIDEKKVIECKPKRLFNSNNVICKKIYAEKLFKKRGYVYELYDPGEIDYNLIIDLYDSKDIILMDKYKLKIEEYKLKVKK